jgi:hypothetical protein
MIAGGCAVMPAGFPGEVAFSPDGAQVAFAWWDAVYVGPAIMLPFGVMPETFYGQWAGAQTTWPVMGTRLEGRLSVPYASIPREAPPVFSPDSRFVAFQHARCIVVVDVRASREVLRMSASEKDPPPGQATAHWLTSRKIAMEPQPSGSIASPKEMRRRS